MNIQCSRSTELTFLGESIVEETTRSLHYLRAIEETIFAVNLITDRMALSTEFAVKGSARLKTDPFDAMCDESGRNAEALLDAQTVVLELYNVFIEKRDAARRDRNLKSDDGVEDCFTHAIATAADLHNALNDLRWIIYEHDAHFQKSESGQELSGADQIEAFLSSL